MNINLSDIGRQSLDSTAVSREIGSFRPRRQMSEARLRRMDEVLDLFSEASDGDRRAVITFQEAMSTSDFQYLFGDVLHRELLNSYTNIDPVWPMFAARSTVNDFRPKKYVDLLGGQALLEPVPQLAPYPQRKASDQEYLLQAQKYGGRYSISWEDTINDDLEALRRLPGGLAQGAHDTEDWVATNLVASAAGPNPGLFGATALQKVVYAGGSTDNRLAGNPALSTQSLSDAITTVQSRKDIENRPLRINGFVLMVPQALEVTANNIVNAIQIRQTIGNQTTLVGNWLANKVTVVMNPWLSIVDQSANANSTWYLLPKPESPRPGVVVGFLRGHESPDLRYADAAGMAVGGGALPATEGSFDTDDISYRVRHILGGTTLDPIATASSNGSGA